MLAAPIVRDFMKVALADKPAVPFRVPAGIKLIRIDAKSGMRAAPGDQRVILEAFKPGTAPPDNYSVIGVTDAEGRPLGGVARGRQHGALAHRHWRSVLKQFIDPGPAEDWPRDRSRPCRRYNLKASESENRLC